MKSTEALWLELYAAANDVLSSDRPSRATQSFDRLCRAMDAINPVVSQTPDMKAVLEERNRLRQFAEGLMQPFWDDFREPDGEDVQDGAEKHGLIEKRPHAQPCQIEHCNCEGEADYLYYFVWNRPATVDEAADLLIAEKKEET